MDSLLLDGAIWLWNLAREGKLSPYSNLAVSSRSAVLSSSQVWMRH